MKASLLVLLALGWCALAQARQAGTEEKVETPVRGGPVDIHADRLTVHQKERRAVFDGNVRTVSAEMEITCDRLTVTYAGEKDSRAQAGEIKLMVFTGSVSIKQNSRSGYCRRAVYDRPAGSIDCTGDPWVVEGHNRIRGERIVYLLERDEVQVTRPRARILLPEESGKKGGLRR